MKKQSAGNIFIITVALLSCVWGLAAESFKYEAKGKRDPFVPLIGPESSKVSGLSDIVSVDEVKLEGVAFCANGKCAVMMNGEILKEGDKVGELEVKKVTRDNVVLLIGGKEYTLKLPEEGGQKSE